MSQVIETIQQWQTLRKGSSFDNKSIGFVPTMGALHEGHLSLLQQSRKDNDISVLSIFLNPTQFNKPEDLEHYPRTFEQDLKIANSAGVDYIFFPKSSEIYHDSYHYKVTEDNLAKRLCGAHRPGHFDGVLTVVLKLFNLVRPTNAYFGEKDYQQYLLIKGMSEAFFIDLNIILSPTIRAKDSLPLSSRNKRFQVDERILAASFSQLLATKLDIHELQQRLEFLGFKVDYIEEFQGRRFGAAHLGSVRLIDNVIL